MSGLFKRILRAIRDAESPATPAQGPTRALVTTGRYLAAVVEKELRQGEIISGVTRYIVNASSEDETRVETSGIVVPFAIVATPDCDLLHSFRALRDGKAERINGVLFFEAEEAAPARKRIPFNSAEWRLVSRNNMEGYHLLTDFKSEIDLLRQQIPDLLVDFKRYFMLPTAEVYRQCRAGAAAGGASRRCCLGDLWREDMQQRAMSFMQRVGTPDPADAA